MRIVTWNMGIAFGPYKADHERAWHALMDLAPDIACVQESEPPDWVKQDRDVVAGPHQFWASAIVTRLPIRPVPEQSGTAIERLGSYLAIAEVMIPSVGEVVVASVHESTRPASTRLLGDLDPEVIRRRSVPEPWCNDVVWHSLAPIVRGRRFIVAGDWNTSRWCDADGVPDPAGQEFMDRAAAHGWVDLHQQANGHEERSWFGGHIGPREHLPDIVFTDETTAVSLSSCKVLQPWARDMKLSDHAPVVAELSLEESA